MSHIPLLRTIIALAALLASCVPLQSAGQDANPLPSPASDWSLSLKQSGGFAGVNLTVEVSSDGRLTAADERSGRKVTQNLAPETLARLSRLYSRLPLTSPERQQSSCADCFLYDLRAGTGGRFVEIHADDTTLAASGAAELIKLLQELRDNALRSQP